MDPAAGAPASENSPIPCPEREFRHVGFMVLPIVLFIVRRPRLSRRTERRFEGWLTVDTPAVAGRCTQGRSRPRASTKSRPNVDGSLTTCPAAFSTVLSSIQTLTPDAATRLRNSNATADRY